MAVLLPAEMVLTSAREVRVQLLSALGRDEPLELDATQVERVDVAGLQLVCGLHKSADKQGKTVTFRDGWPGAVLCEAASLAGFKRHQGCMTGCLWVGQKP